MHTLWKDTDNFVLSDPENFIKNQNTLNDNITQV